MKTKLLNFFMVFVTVIGICSCSEDEVVSRSEFTLRLNYPTGLTDVELSDVAVTLKNVNTGRSESGGSVVDDRVVVSVPQGLYTISVEGKVKYKSSDKELTAKVLGYKESVSLLGVTSVGEINLFLYNEKVGFVIEEIFFTGTVTPEGKQYSGDKYFKICNNSDVVLYADGLTIAESQFLTVDKYDYTPDILSSAMTVKALYSVPGTGEEHPVEPGGSIVICDNAINHRAANSLSMDLSGADFEWYDESTNPNMVDIDNPAVPNLDKIYCYTKTIWGPHNQGYTSYALAWLEVDRDTFLLDYKYDYQYTMIINGVSYPMTGSAFKLPNTWIIDAVNLSAESEYQWIVTDPSLDMGWTYCATQSGDKERYGKSVRRKVLSVATNGGKRLKDTNNSTVDFDAKVVPSLMK